MILLSFSWCPALLGAVALVYEMPDLCPQSGWGENRTLNPFPMALGCRGKAVCSDGNSKSSGMQWLLGAEMERVLTAGPGCCSEHDALSRL